MKLTAHTAKSASTPKGGLRAMLRVFLHIQGTGAPAPGQIGRVALPVALPAPRRIVPALLLALAAALALTSATAHAAEACPNESIRQLEPYASALPDCRAYEQVTPVEKNATNPAGPPNLVQASPDGDGLVFLVPANMPGSEGSSNVPVFLASRAFGSWSNEGLLPSSPPGVKDDVLGWSKDLTQTALGAQMPSDSSPSLYLRDNASGTYQLVVSALGGETHFAGFSADDHSLIFETAVRLLESATAEKTNLYVLHNGNLSLA
ncbi:MAG: hypothetical protein ACRDK7_08935 [Solirubrobacteraceae bacterium]